MVGKTNIPENSNWQERYYNSLKALEEKESEWSQLHRLMTSVLTQLSLFAEAQHPVLENNLQTLRDALLSEPGLLELQPLFNDVKKQLVQVYEEKNKGKSSTARHCNEVDIEKVRTVVMDMINGSDIPDEYIDRIMPLKDLLSANEEHVLIPNVARVLESFTGILVDIYRSIKIEQEKLEYYLKQLTVQLSDLDNDVSASEKLRLNVQRSSSEVEHAVNTEVKEMENSISEATNLDSLKQIIQHRVMAVREHMNGFRKREEAYNEQSSRLIGRLSKRLHQMEKEAQRLRIQIHEKHKQSLSDALTGLPNRKAYDTYLEKQFVSFMQTKIPFSLLVFDIDFFKKINDNFGHVSGDKILKHLASLLRKSLRKGDFLARYGGEEFVMIMPNTTLKDARLVAEQLRMLVQKQKFNDKSKKIAVTISGGVGEVRADDTIVSLFERADNALYVAKESGRNRIETE